MTAKIAAALTGAGAMGGALLRGWLVAGAIDPHRSSVFEPAADDRLTALCRKGGIALNPPLEAVEADALVLAVKPQMAEAALPAYQAVASRALVLSVMAGTSLATIGRLLGDPPRMARAMPNLAASVGAAVSGLYAPERVGEGDRSMVERLMSAVGDTVWVMSETAIDVVTAVSGSGPAYFFLLTEALAEAGEAQGLPGDAAMRLARATARGAGAVLSGDADPLSLRSAVTSPGGTTAAALAVLDGDDQTLRLLMKKAVAAAARRAAELSK